MLRLMFRFAEHLVLCGLILLGLTLGSAAAKPRLGGEDVVSSYTGADDRVVFSGPSQESDTTSSLGQPDKTTLFMQDLKTSTKTKLFETLNGELGRLEVAPSGGTVAVQIYAHQGDLSSNPKLLVLTTEGKEITAFGQSRDFAWSPDSRFLAYTTGIPDDGEVLSTGTWLYDQKLKSTRKIGDKGDFVAWSPSDNNLYIWSFAGGNRHISRYDPRTQVVLQTKLRGIFFSPTGRYYHAGIPRHGEGSVEVYDTESNQPLFSHRPRLASVLPHARIVGWASEGDVLILEVFSQGPKTEELPQGRVDTVLYDVVHDIARVIQNDSVIGWQRGQVIVHDRGKFTKRAVTSLPLLPDHPEKPAPPSGIPAPFPKP